MFPSFSFQPSLFSKRLCSSFQTRSSDQLSACRKLTYAPSSIASIGYELGFQDPAYFSRLFKKRVGLTPKQFRLQPS
jgi:AraC-like DNA-binding protein